jgi:hypothetical protein
MTPLPSDVIAPCATGHPAARLLSFPSMSISEVSGVADAPREGGRPWNDSRLADRAD